MEEKHNIYLKHLGRFAEKEILFSNNISLDENIVSQSPEAQGRLKFLESLKTNSTNTTSQIIDWFCKELYYLPNFSLLSLYKDLEDAKQKYSQTSDWKYLNECRQTYEQLAEATRDPEAAQDSKTKKPILHFYGPVGTSGYAKACREIVTSIKDYYNIRFFNIQFHSFNPKTCALDDKVLLKRSYLPSQIPKDEIPDIVILHSTPELWKTYRRQYGPNVFIYGITVWETDIAPSLWYDYIINSVNYVTTPSQYSTNSLIARGIPASMCDTVYHPVITNFSKQKSLQKQKPKTLLTKFYCISEGNSNRKGLFELLESWKLFQQNFPECQLTLKTSKRDKHSQEFLELAENLQINNNLNLIMDFLSDEQINNLHSENQVYVTLAKSEGQGLGACIAACYGNVVISLDYGGCPEYIGTSSYLVKCNKTIPATMCESQASSIHDLCKYYPACRFFPNFDPLEMNWGYADPLDFSKAMQEIHLNGRKIYNKKNNISWKFSYAKIGKQFKDSIKKALKNSPPNLTPNMNTKKESPQQITLQGKKCVSFINEFERTLINYLITISGSRQDKEYLSLLFKNPELFGEIIYNFLDPSQASQASATSAKCLLIICKNSNTLDTNLILKNKISKWISQNYLKKDKTKREIIYFYIDNFINPSQNTLKRFFLNKLPNISEIIYDESDPNITNSYLLKSLYTFIECSRKTVSLKQDPIFLDKSQILAKVQNDENYRNFLICKVHVFFGGIYTIQEIQSYTNEKLVNIFFNNS